MSYFVAFPANLVDDLLGNLPAGMRSTYEEQFVSVVGSLVWIFEDAESALQQALEQNDHPLAEAWLQDPKILRDLANKLIDQENDELTCLVNSGLEDMAATLIYERIRLLEPPSQMPDDPSLQEPRSS
jgi:hypothetical protein